jgi:hypothetical protein
MVPQLFHLQVSDPDPQFLMEISGEGACSNSTLTWKNVIFNIFKNGLYIIFSIFFLIFQNGLKCMRIPNPVV